MKKFPYGYPEYDDLTPSYDIPTFVRTCATRYGDTTAVSYRKVPTDKDTVCVSYRTFGEDIAALARALDRRNLRGARIAVVGAASYDWVCLFFAIQSIGAVMVPLDREWGAEELNGAVKKAECTCVFLDSELEEKLAVIEAGRFFMKREG